MQYEETSTIEIIAVLEHDTFRNICKLIAEVVTYHFPRTKSTVVLYCRFAVL